MQQLNLTTSGLRRYFVLTTWFVLAASRPAAAAEPIPNIGPAGDVEKVATGFGFTEGPAWDGKQLLYFTDVRNARIHTVNAAGEVAVFAEDTGPCNGLMFDRDGQLVACNMGGGQLVAWNVDTKDKRVLAGEFEGQRFNAPNDLVIDAAGGVYFTDPMFGAPQPLPQGVQGVYYRSADGKVSRVVNNAPAPNGVLLSRDEKTLYVLPSMSPEMQAYPVEAPGQLGEMRVFCKVKNPPGRNGGCDGATIDEHGNLYLTTGLGVQVFSPQGEALGVIEVPEQPANCTFGGPDGKTLYVTARTSLYAFPMLVKGHWYAQRK